MTDSPQPKPQGLLCPVCRTDLLMSERQGIEIDYCPKCRGVWLDRGELDKIIERSERENRQNPSGGRQVADQSSASFLPQPGASPWGGTPQAVPPSQSGYPAYSGSPQAASGSYDSHGQTQHYDNYGGGHGHRRGGHGHHRGFLSRLFD